ncbi:MAG: biotin transporter BioY [Beijerinckiaceae bacterium]|nr:biotin transporter BioY [Beijerinckiaceae bacterium]
MRVATATLIQQALGSRERNILRDLALVLVGTMLLALSAKIQIPFYPVPMTMQSLVVMMIGAAYGWKLGGLTILAYLAEGALGLPVFASGAGLAYMMGPTGGYLVGFLLAAMATGYLAERGLTHSVIGAIAVLSLGHVINFIPGYAWLATLIGPELAFAKGVAPFGYATLLKVGLGAALLPASWWAVRTWRNG